MGRAGALGVELVVINLQLFRDHARNHLQESCWLFRANDREDALAVLAACWRPNS